MNSVELKPDGIIYEGRNPIETDPLRLLGYKVEFSGRVTLRSFFKLIEKYEVLSRLNSFLPTYMGHYRSCTEQNCVNAGIDHLELTKTIEMIGFPGEPRLEIYITLQGLKGSETVDLTNIGIDTLLDMPLSLGKLKHIIMGDRVDTFEFDTVFNLFEFIDGIVWELSFLGTLTGCPIRR